MDGGEFMTVNTLSKTAIAAYETAYTETDFEVTQAAYRKKLLIEQLNKLKPKRILEVGCGWDTISNHWDQFEALTIIEPGPGFAKKARHDTGSRLNVRVIEEFLESVPNDELQGYDCILLSSLLHEVDDDELFLQTVKRACGPNTIVHLNVPNAASMHRLLALEMGLISDVKATSDMQKHYQQTRIYDLTTLTALITKLGFKVTEKGSFLVKPFTHAQMQSLVESKFLSKKMLDGFYRLAKHFPENGSEIYVNFSLENEA